MGLDISNLNLFGVEYEFCKDKLAEKADAVGEHDSFVAGTAKQLLSQNSVMNTEPYFSRPSASIGDREFDELVGGTLVWNQLCNGSSVTVESGHKYYMIKGGTASVGASDGTAITGLTSGTDIVIDLTIDFGTTIADYIYSLEQATAGAGVAWVRKYLPNDYYAYCAPTLKHVSGVSAHVMRDANNNIIGNYPIDSTWGGMGIPKLDSDGKLYFDGDRYASDGTVTERYGIVDLGTLDWYNAGDNKLFYSTGLASEIRKATSNDEQFSWGITSIGLEGKSYNGIGTSTPYAICASTLGNLLATLDISTAYADAAAFKTAMSGVYLVYELATPTASTASPFTSPQICDPDGTEEYVTTGLVPVGHETSYPNDLRGVLDEIATAPAEDGTYTLKCIKDGNTVTMTWVADE